MNASCSGVLLESALAGSLSAEEERSLQRHLEECEECGAALEQMAGGTAWCREAAALLTEDELDAAAPAQHAWSEVDFTVEHLEPADEPGVLGRLGGYDVLEILGHGGMGIVLKAFDRELKRCVAIKVLAPHLAQSSLAKKRFAREAQAAAAVVHPHVLAIHQVQPGGRLPFLVMPLVAGESLAERLAAQGTLELREVLRIGMQAAAGLAAAHEQGLVHRDVKPANILLEKGVERAVLTDFGLARAADDVSLTRWGIIAGTPEYMSPEQARGEPLDGRSDLFSLGCVLYEMATGVSPFRADSTLATMRRLVDESPRAMASLNPELPPWFISLVRRLLEKNPSRRYGSAKEVSELLESCLAHVQQPANVPLPAEFAKRPPHSLRSIVIITIGVLVMIAASLVGLFGILLLAADPPDIAGEWSGDDWGKVVLKQTSEGVYSGTYTDTYRQEPGEIQLKWSRVERRFNGKWSEGEERFGELSVRQVGNEVRGAWTTDAKSKINPGAPHLADLAWRRPGSSEKPAGDGMKYLTQRVPFEIGATLLRDGDRITIDEVRGTDDALKAGNTYEVRGTYVLASHDKAQLAVYITTSGAAEKSGKAPASPTLKVQWTEVERGKGKFALAFVMSHDGHPHLSFYSIGNEARGFAHVYFGTGDSVLKKGWWEARAGGAKPTALLPEKLSATKEHVAYIEKLLRSKPVTTNYLAELFELTPGSKSEYRLRSDVVRIPIVPAEKGRLDFIPMGTVHYMLASKGFYIQWDSPAASTLHYYGPFYGVSLDKLGDTVSAKLIERGGEPKSTNEEGAAPKGVLQFPTRERVGIIACSPDGKRVAVANDTVIFPLSDDWKRTVEILDAGLVAGHSVASLQLVTKEEHALLAATEGLPGFEIGSLAFSPDGSVLAVAVGLGQVKLYTAKTGELIRSLDDEKGKLAEKKTPEKLKALKRAMGSVNALTFSSDGSLLATCGTSFDDYARSWGNIERGGLTTTGPGRLKVWEVESGKLKHDLAGHSHAQAVSFSADGSLLASAGSWAGGTDGGHGVIVWDSRTGEKLRKIPSDTNGWTHAVVFSPTSKLLAIGSLQFDKENDTRETTISLTYALTGIREWQRTVPGGATPKAFSPDGKTIAALCGRNSIQFFETETGKMKLELKSADSSPGERWHDFAIAPKAPKLFIGGSAAEMGGIVTVRDLDSEPADAR
jgi:serine/threonine protein kinase/WD40 repeat protein